MRWHKGRAGGLWLPGSFRARASRPLVFGYPPSGGLAALVSAAAAPAPPPFAPDFFVSPTGGTGAGSINDPWGLSYALSGAGGAITPGKQVALRGGTYNGAFTGSVNGTASNPIVFRQYPGERATIDGHLFVQGSYAWYQGFEIKSSTPATDTFAGVYHQGPNTKLINLVIHDRGASGIIGNTLSPNSEIYGCLVYNNGVTFNQDHGIYVSNNAGTKLLRNNIIFNNWKYGIQLQSSTGNLLNIHCDGNIGFGNGSISSPGLSGGATIVIGGAGAQGFQYTNNMNYEIPGSIFWAFNDTEFSTDGIFTGNTFVQNAELFAWDTAIVSNNVFYSYGPVNGKDVVAVQSPVSGWTWANNTHYRNSAAAAWYYNGTGNTFAAWRTATGLGASDTNPGTAPVGTQVTIQANAYEAGRANIVIYNWAGAAIVNVDLSAILTVGQAYDIFNAQNFFGGAIVSGTYAGSVAIPTAGITPVAPIGRAYVPGPITGPTFQTFVVRLQGA